MGAFGFGEMGQGPRECGGGGTGREGVELRADNISIADVTPECLGSVAVLLNVCWEGLNAAFASPFPVFNISHAPHVTCMFPRAGGAVMKLRPLRLQGDPSSLGCFKDTNLAGDVMGQPQIRTSFNI